ncbi:MAG: dTDP-glucose 4,6-dehydratase [Acidobacteria bacterium]|nr:dTDP-glucose 4,6-dehydratase [Acidobacteriota bacterium]
MKLLVTGGAGFIGSNFIRHLFAGQAGLRVVNLDLLTYAGRQENLSDLAGHPGYRFVRGDVADRDLVAHLLADGVDAVIHFAAESHVDRSINGADPFIHTNVVGTHCLVEAARRAGVRRFIQISSDEVYGPVPEGRQAGPDAALSPSNPYAASKAAADLLVAAAWRTHGFPGIITRCTNNYGPWQHPEKFIPVLAMAALQGREMPIYGDGLQVRDWIHVEDHCRVLAAILLNGEPGQTYTIAGGNSVRNLDMARRILDLAGQPGAAIRHVQDRPGHDRRYDLDDGVTRREFRWEPRISLSDGLTTTVDWYRAHRDWWEPLTKSSAQKRRHGVIPT